MPKEIVPGLFADNTGDDLADIKRDIAERDANRKIEEGQKAHTLLSEAAEQIGKGVRIKITDEMRELGIDKKILEMAIREEACARFSRMGGGDDDFDDADPYPWLG